ncbi:MAG TPA: helix-turn-helix domain-containing protein [Thermomicrobiaceae bacterium]|nr:helix-turn-helix domain-containing protein [Thermomicrobiaceae bacterium]
MGQVPQRREADAYTISETAEILQFHPDAVRYWVRVGELPSEPDPRGDDEDLLVRAESIVAFLRQNGEMLPTDLPGTQPVSAIASVSPAASLVGAPLPTAGD